MSAPRRWRVRQVLPRLDVFARVALDEIRPAAVEDHVAVLARRAPRQAEVALRAHPKYLHAQMGALVEPSHARPLRRFGGHDD
jgi:hypothetical protein